MDKHSNLVSTLEQLLDQLGPSKANTPKQPMLSWTATPKVILY